MKKQYSKKLKEGFEFIMHNEIFEYVKVIILKIKPSIHKEISEEDDIVENLGFSSFEVYVLLYNLETELKIIIPNHDIVNNTKIRDLLNLIAQYKQ